MYNKLVVIGNLTRDIELKYSVNGSAIAKSSIATSHKYKTQSGEQKEEICYIEFTIFGRIGEVANQYLKKGSKVFLEGRLIQENWTTQDGQNRSKHTLRVDEMKMLDSKNTNQQSQQQAQYQQPQQQQNIPEIEYDLDEDGNSTIPF